MKASDLKGRAVLTLSDAAKIGQIDDVLFDSDYRNVLGFRVKQSLFGKSDAVARDSVTGIGADAVTIASPDLLNEEGRIESLSISTSLSKVRGTKVVSEGGDLLGVVDEIELDDSALNVTAYILEAPLLDRLRHRAPRIDAAEVLRLGEGGLMIVPNSVADALKTNDE